jgi:uncharacterized phage protein (TIGR01671 family)
MGYGVTNYARNQVQGMGYEPEKIFPPIRFLYQLDGGLLFLDDEHGGSVPNLSGKWTEDEQERFELMQYTGLKDKNGKEIYEDDIAIERYESAMGHRFKERGVVEYRDGHYYIGKYFIDMAGRIELEVIGNIYENPELLTSFEKPKV